MDWEFEYFTSNGDNVKFSCSIAYSDPPYNETTILLIKTFGNRPEQHNYRLEGVTLNDSALTHFTAFAKDEILLGYPNAQPDSSNKGKLKMEALGFKVER